jgi:hypothetical protein
VTYRKVYTRLLAALGATLVALALAAPAARAATPAPGYTQFAGCPSPEENPAVFACLRSVITSGHFQMGSKDVPITNPITFSGGYDGNLNFFANSKGGLSPTKQEVPGGIVGLTGLDWLVKFLGVDALKVYAVTELAGTPGAPVVGQDFTLPIKVHLINPALGNNCYVGSNANPIVLNLTNGTTSPPPPNQPISGKEPELAATPGEIFDANNGIYVDNEFAAPGASGCTLTLLGLLPLNLNPLINLQSGLPSPAGTNETVQNYDAELVESRLVYP